VPQIAEELARQFVYVEQGRSGTTFDDFHDFVADPPPRAHVSEPMSTRDGGAVFQFPVDQALQRQWTRLLGISQMEWS